MIIKATIISMMVNPDSWPKERRDRRPDDLEALETLNLSSILGS